jgi:translation elongation factor EF-1beta
MTTKPPAKVKPDDPDSPVKKIYSMVDEFADVIPVPNDRNRLAFCIHRYYQGITGSIHEAVMAARPESCTIELDELEQQLEKKYNDLNITNNEQS